MYNRLHYGKHVVLTEISMLIWAVFIAKLQLYSIICFDIAQDYLS